MKNLTLLLGTIIGTVVLIVGVALMFSNPNASTTSTTQQFDPALLLENATKRTGKADALVKVVEFSDFQCPSCLATEPTVKQLIAKNPDTVEFIYRHFPLDQIHHNARLAAQAAEVAREAGKFWEYHDLLFSKQSEWEKITDKKELIAKFAGYAAELQIDNKSFSEKIESDDIVKAVQADQDLGSKLSVDATPTFYVNGKKTAAPQLQTTVESFLTEKK